LRVGSIKNKNKKSSQNHDQSVWACSSSAPNTSAHSSQDQQNTEITSIIELNSFAICIRDQL
jgi:hypothetical protein